MPIFKSLIYIGLGVNRFFNDMPMLISGLVFPLEKSIPAEGKSTKNCLCMLLILIHPLPRKTRQRL